MKIAFGTDQGAMSNRAKGEEFALMVAAGVTPVDAILYIESVYVSLNWDF